MRKFILGLFMVIVFISCSKSNDQQTETINIDHLTKHTWVLDSGIITLGILRSVQIPPAGERWAAQFTANTYTILLPNEDPEVRSYLFKAKDTVFYWEASSQLDPDQYMVIRELNAQKLITTEREASTSAMVETYMHAE